MRLVARAISLLLGVGAVMVLWSGVAMADTVFDPQIFVGPPGSTSPPGGTAVGGESNLITGSPTLFTVGVAGNHTMQDPLLIIFGAYPGSVANPTLGGPGCPASGCPLATVGTDYGLTANTKTFSSGDSYNVLGLSDNGSGAASESFGNWQTADSKNGFPAPANYELFVFAVPDILSGKSPINLSESGLADGSFVIAYSCEAPDPTLAGCTGGAVGASPFTNAGLIDVPEPSALPVAGLVLGALVTAWRTRKDS